LKYHGIIIAEISKTGGEEDKEQLAIENSSVKSKKAAFTK